MNKRKVLWLITLGVSVWVAAMATGQLIVLISGIPASSGVINGFLVPFLLVLGVQMVRSHWGVTISFTIYSLLSIPTVLLGPPGIHKLFVGCTAGLITDFIIFLLGKLKANAIVKYSISFLFWGLSLAFLALLCYKLIDLPGKEKFFAAFVAMALIFVIGSVVGSILATYYYKKRELENSALVKRLNS